MFISLKNKFLRKCQDCYVFFSQDQQLLGESLSSYIERNFNINCEEFSYQILTKRIVQDINKKLQKSCIVILIYSGEITFENCYKLGLAHAYNRWVVLIDIKNEGKAHKEVPSYMKYNFIMYQVRISQKEDFSNFLSKLKDIISAILSGDILNILYQEALGICEYVEERKGCRIVRFEKEVFIQSLTDEDCTLYFNDYNVSYQNLLEKIVKNKEILDYIYYESMIRSEVYDECLSSEYLKENLPRQSSFTPKPVFMFNQSTSKSTARDLVFISYSHKDKKWFNELKIHLEPLIRGQNLKIWDDTQIQPGAIWRDEIKKALAAAKVAVLLVSPAFLSSNFISENELPVLLDAAETEGVKILWVPLQASSYRVTAIEKYQAIYPIDRPLRQIIAAKRDTAWVEVCTNITAAMNR